MLAAISVWSEMCTPTRPEGHLDPQSLWLIQPGSVTIAQCSITTNTTATTSETILVDPAITFLTRRSAASHPSPIPTPLPTPRIVFPESINQSQPVELHVVAGQTAILECVIWQAKVCGINLTCPCPPCPLQMIEPESDRSGEPQDQASECGGLRRVSVDLRRRLLEEEHPRVRYKLVVHAPTNVRLMLAQQMHDKSWQLSCYAHNLRYEIPMVYVNGLALIDAMEEMGVPHKPTFTPTLSIASLDQPWRKLKSTVLNWKGQGHELICRQSPKPKGYSSSQKPSPDQVDTHASSPMSLEAQEPKQTTETQEVEEKQFPTQSIPLEIAQPVAFVAGDHRDEAKGQEGRGRRWGEDDESEEDENDTEEWSVSDHVQPHVRALTIPRLVPDSDYQFRITAHFNDRSRLSSQPTVWLGIEQAQPVKPVVPAIPQITRLQTVSHESMLLAWNHTSQVPSGLTQLRKPKWTNTSSTTLPWILECGEEPNESRGISKLTYILALIDTSRSENEAGRSPSSRPRIARTYVVTGSDFDSGGNVWWGKVRRTT
uniref:Fibronectin type-III domain-containing protein n=1 Tax=Ditylenchus dipsaci TaxID=166011 RepID=A0A915DAQ3_9BILA